MACEQKRQLLAAYRERTEALVVEAELLLRDIDGDCGGGQDRWYRLEQARIGCEIARLALSAHTDGHEC